MVLDASRRTLHAVSYGSRIFICAGAPCKNCSVNSRTSILPQPFEQLGKSAFDEPNATVYYVVIWSENHKFGCFG